jgi:hypothetical protein
MPIIGSFGAGSKGGFGRGGKKPFNAEYLVIGGGGAGGAQTGGAGGAGGYRLNVPGETSGRNSVAEAEIELLVGTSYQLTVGAGASSTGAGPFPRPARPRGEDSVFASITSIGGGTGTPVTSPEQVNGGAASGGGGSTGTPGQGFDAGPPNSVPYAYGTTGAGAAGGTGAATPNGGGSTGGAGLFSSITGTPVQRAGGGGGGNRPGQHGGGPFVPGGPGGPGGGGAGSNTHQSAGTPGDANTGGGGGDEGYNNQPPGNPFSIGSGSGAGGSGLVVIKVPTDITASFTPGVTQNPSSTPTHNIYTVTAAGGSDEVTFSG